MTPATYEAMHLEVRIAGLLDLERGWSESRIRKVMGENWLRVLRDAWGA